MDIIMRYAEITDYLWLKEHEQDIPEETLKMKIDNKEIYIVQDNNKIIGFLRYNLFWDNIPFMNKIYLLKEYRRKGIGARLVKYWEGSIKRKGYKNVLTSTQSNEEGQHFYRKIGYIEIGGLKYLEDPYEIMKIFSNKSFPNLSDREVGTFTLPVCLCIFVHTNPIYYLSSFGTLHYFSPQTA